MDGQYRVTLYYKLSRYFMMCFVTKARTIHELEPDLPLNVLPRMHMHAHSLSQLGKALYLATMVQV